MKRMILLSLVLAAPAYADDDVPPPEAPKEAPAEPEPPKPEPELEPKPVETPHSTGGEAFGIGVSEQAGSAPIESHRGAPTLAVELSAFGATNANPYLQHEGWNFETGPARGLRLEAQWNGVSLGVETSSMANKRVCGVGCFDGDYGRTSFTAVDLGFRFRFTLGPLRPFLAGAIGGLRASSGDWTMDSGKTVYGGHARAGAGVELPLPGKLFASGQIGYRFAVTKNPLRDPDKETLDTALLGTDTTAATVVEDAHQIMVSLGVGIEL